MNADPQKAALAFGARKVDTVQIDGKEFSRGRWRANDVYQLTETTSLKGYLVNISVFSCDKRILDEFERGIQQIAFFDSQEAQQQAGPDSRAYSGPPQPVSASGQQSSRPSGGVSSAQPATPPKLIDVPGQKPGIFYDKDLDVHFTYTVEMRALDASADMESGHQNIFGTPGDDDPEHQQAKKCIRPLLDAELPVEKAPQRAADVGAIWVDDSRTYKESRKPEPIFAKVLFVEVVRDCLPKKLRKNENDALGNIALSFVSAPGIQRMPNPIWYETGKQKIHMNSGVGRVLVNGHLADAPIIVMAMSTQWRGHLLAWVFTSNDAQVFNETTKSLVQFGDGPWGPMFAANIGPPGSGTPMTVLPK